jgi:proteinaceous RNase P
MLAVGPHDILIDGANVAFSGQNREGGGFNWGQIMRMWEFVRKLHPECKPLLVRS